MFVMSLVLLFRGALLHSFIHDLVCINAVHCKLLALSLSAYDCSPQKRVIRSTEVEIPHKSEKLTSNTR